METAFKKIVGQRLQLLRLEKNLTQEQMGEQLNLSTSAYCKIEYGETDLTLTRLKKIAEIVKMSATELFYKIDGDTTNLNSCNGIIGYTQHNENCNLGNVDDLRELIKANNKIINMLEKRIEILETRLS